MFHCSNIHHRSYTYICGLKSLLGGICRVEGGNGTTMEDYTAKELVEMSYLWHKGEAVQSWALKLQALRLFPFFLSPLPHNATLNDADAYGIISCLRQFTIGIDDISRGVCTESADETFDSFWRRGPASRILGEYVLAHIESISSDKEGIGSPEPRRSSFTSPWGAMVTASIVYMQTVLVALQPVDKRMHKYTITSFHHDMASHLSASQASSNPGFILWLLLLGMIGCHTYTRDEQDSVPHPSTQFFGTALRRQAKEMGVSSWSEARRILVDVVWPQYDNRFGFVGDFWDEAMLK